MTAALLGGLGWATRSILARMAKYGTWMIESMSDHQGYDRELQLLNRVVPQVKEDLAILTREVERHLQWHEDDRRH